MALIKLENVWRRVDGREILRNVNLEIDKGEVVAFIGPTGAGKTTLLRLIDLLDTPSSGNLYFDGVDTAAAAAPERLKLRRRMGFVLQKPVVFNTSVYENIACGLRWRGVAGEELSQRVEGLLGMVGISDYRNRNAKTLSGGEGQRVAIARALAIEPEVLLMDEPTANLDPISASKVEELILKIIGEAKTTIVMSTHDMAQGQRLAGRIGVLMDGTLLQVGSSGDIFTLPRSREVAEFVGMENILSGVVLGNDERMVTVDVSGKLVEAISDYGKGETVLVLVRPEDITLCMTRITSSARNSFASEVTRVTVTGPLARVEIDCGFPLVALVTKRSAEEMGLVKGKPVFASFKATGVHVIKKNA